MHHPTFMLKWKDCRSFLLVSLSAFLLKLTFEPIGPENSSFQGREAQQQKCSWCNISMALHVTSTLSILCLFVSRTRASFTYRMGIWCMKKSLTGIMTTLFWKEHFPHPHLLFPTKVECHGVHTRFTERFFLQIERSNQLHHWGIIHACIHSFW